MNRAWFGAWGAALEPDRFAAAVAAVGVTDDKVGSYAQRAIEVAWKSPVMRWRTPASLGAYGAAELAKAWLTWRADWQQRNPPPRGADPRVDPSPMPRLAVDWSDGLDPGWVISQLSRDAVGPLSVHVSDHRERGAAHWGWPLEIGVLDDRDAHLLAERLAADEDSTIQSFVRVRPVWGAGGTCDVLLLTAPLRTAAGAVLTAGIRASCLVCLRAPTERWSVTGPLLRALQAHVDASAFGYSPIPAGCRLDWLHALVRALARAHPLDVAMRQAARRVGATPPVLFARDQFLEETRLPRVEQRARARHEATAVVRDAPAPGGAAGALPASTYRFDEALAGAEALRSLVDSVRDLPPAPARFIQARILDFDRKVLDGPLTPGVPYLVEVRIAEPERGWASAQGAAFPTPEGDVSHRLTVVLIAPDVLSEPLVEEIVLPPRGESSTCAFELVPALETTRLRARIAVLHGNRVLQTALLDVPVGQRTEESLSLTAEPEAAVRLRLDDLDFRRPFDAALLVNHDEAGTAGLTTVSGARARLLLPADFRDATERLYRVLEKAVLEPDGYDTLEDRRSVELLIVLANQGHALYEAFTASEGSQSLVDADRLQLVLLRYDTDFPLEFVYERVAPDPDVATLCPHARESLRAGRCSGCSPPDDPTIVCPMAFWGLTKSIEREPYRGPVETYYPEVREASRGCSALAAPGGALFAASEHVHEEDVDRLRQTLRSALSTPPQEAISWKAWRERVEAGHPPLLVLLPHTDTHPMLKVPALEIGGDSPLAQTNIRPDVICPGGAHRPVVILLGCSTAVTDIGLYAFPPKFHAEGASIVLGTVTKVLGRHAAPVAGMIVAELAARAGSGAAYVTDVIRDVRRSLLAEGRPLGMVLVAYGDGDWTVGSN